MTIYYFGVGNLKDAKLLVDAGAKDVLMSYAYSRGSLNPSALRELGFRNVMLDSGAVTIGDKANKKRPWLTPANYYKYLDEYAKDVTTYIQFDKTGWDEDARIKTTENYNEMLSLGYKPLPVCRGENQFAFDKLFDYYTTKTDYIGMSGAIWSEELAACIFRIPFYSRAAKLHGLAFADIADPLLKYFYSVDATTWMKNAIYSGYKTFDFLDVKKYIRYFPASQIRDFKNHKDWKSNVRNRATVLVHEMLRRLRERRLIDY
jgi:hypothetical protein